MAEQQEPISEGEVTNDEEQKPKKRVYRLLKTPRPETPEKATDQNTVVTTPRRTKTVQIAHRIKTKGPYEDPIPGSIEEDWLLEGEDDSSKFFAVDNLSES